MVYFDDAKLAPRSICVLHISKNVICIEGIAMFLRAAFRRFVVFIPPNLAKDKREACVHRPGN
jgi:hypothetical protein